MALKATICKAELNISDLDRHYYAHHTLTLARHPSETDARMMVRLLAFACHADDRLTFTKGLCVNDEPALWRKSLTDEVELWIEVGQPEEKRLRQACGRARQVVVYAYGGRSIDLWWTQLRPAAQRLDNLTVVALPEGTETALAQLAQRAMALDCTLQEGQIWFGDGATTLTIEPHFLQRAEGG